MRRRPNKIVEYVSTIRRMSQPCVHEPEKQPIFVRDIHINGEKGMRKEDKGEYERCNRAGDRRTHSHIIELIIPPDMVGPRI